MEFLTETCRGNSIFRMSSYLHLWKVIFFVFYFSPVLTIWLTPSSMTIERWRAEKQLSNVVLYFFSPLGRFFIIIFYLFIFLSLILSFSLLHRSVHCTRQCFKILSWCTHTRTYIFIYIYKWSNECEREAILKAGGGLYRKPNKCGTCFFDDFFIYLFYIKLLSPTRRQWTFGLF